eukprot:m.148363 g.148363  ORF g.148363 m.148363 type:complete len:380 (-) comp30588_c0_seq1:118-1257(-)
MALTSATRTLRSRAGTNQERTSNQIKREPPAFKNIPSSKKIKKEPVSTVAKPINEQAEQYPQFTRPTSIECAAVVARLSQMHGIPSQQREKDKDTSILDALVGTILSQNTTDVQSSKGFAALKKAMPSWDAIRVAKASKVEAIIKSCGLAEIKTARIQTILNVLKKERGKCCLEYSRSFSEEDVKKELLRFNGVGPKTVACVLMFAMGRAEFPVDTHVWRISKQLGWVPKEASRETTYNHMNSRVPDDLKYDLHCLLVTHGKHCKTCAKNGKPRKAPLGPCPLTTTADKINPKREGIPKTHANAIKSVSPLKLEIDLLTSRRKRKNSEIAETDGTTIKLEIAETDGTTNKSEIYVASVGKKQKRTRVKTEAAFTIKSEI